jgi:hypothetical protein
VTRVRFMSCGLPAHDSGGALVARTLAHAASPKWLICPGVAQSAASGRDPRHQAPRRLHATATPWSARAERRSTSSAAPPTAASAAGSSCSTPVRGGARGARRVWLAISAVWAKRGQARLGPARTCLLRAGGRSRHGRALRALCGVTWFRSHLHHRAATWTWSEAAASGHAPESRAFHTASLLGRHVLFAGGETESGVDPDVVALDLGAVKARSLIRPHRRAMWLRSRGADAMAWRRPLFDGSFARSLGAATVASNKVPPAGRHASAHADGACTQVMHYGGALGRPPAAKLNDTMSFLTALSIAPSAET